MTTRNYADRLAKLGARLDKYTTDIEELMVKRETIISEINEITGNSPSQKAVYSTQKKGVLWDRISKTLASNPGQDVNSLADTLKVKPNQVALSLWHALQKGKATLTDGKYFPMEQKQSLPSV